jgi:lathosterol oxidase
MMHLFSSMLDLPESLRTMLRMAMMYMLYTGSFYLVFYMWKNKKYWYAKIQQLYPENKYVIREIKYSLSTVLIFTLVISLVVWARINGWTRFYEPISKHGYVYFFFSIGLMVFIHDTYFYWTHRLMHWKPLFKLAHKTHHLSTNPTPFAAYAFHPIEAFVEVGILPLIAFTIPYNRSAIIIFGIYSLSLNVMGHLGFELFPKGFATHRLFKWHNTSTHHNMHHRLVKCNYGLYFNFWDRLMKTNHPHYEESFNDVVEKREQEKIDPNKVVLHKAFEGDF